MTPADLLSELDFIRLRTSWLKRQPRDAGGILLRSDDRAEAAMLKHRVEELEREYRMMT